MKCHAIGGVGGRVGPGLESIGASAPVDYLLDSILEPDKAIKENYHSLVVATIDGRILSGLKVRQDDDTLVLRDANDQEMADCRGRHRRAKGWRLAHASRTHRGAHAARVGRPRPVSFASSARSARIPFPPANESHEGGASWLRRFQATPRLAADRLRRGDPWRDHHTLEARLLHGRRDLPTSELQAFETLGSQTRMGLARCDSTCVPRERSPWS